MTAADLAPRKLVVDASVAVKWVVPEEDSQQARALLETSADGHLDLIAPAHLLAEATNAVWARTHLRKELSILNGQLAVALLRSADVSYISIEDLIQQAYDLAVTQGRTVYDCLYVVLALREDGLLVTADRVLATTFASTGRVTLLSEFEART